MALVHFASKKKKKGLSLVRDLSRSPTVDNATIPRQTFKNISQSVSVAITFVVCDEIHFKPYLFLTRDLNFYQYTLMSNTIRLVA